MLLDKEAGCLFLTNEQLVTDVQRQLASFMASARNCNAHILRQEGGGVDQQALDALAPC